eukprot:TRINITY_DN4451_c0_g1_i2.p2 TRINITY_DN4451_c0_g1~~TRINITY_DN4451_c0_g1_i2.p2  ORF type:complete len:109 (+),score=35.16 TRINITY_DN4451_c0_g1_i2:85-411(+)
MSEEHKISPIFEDVFRRASKKDDLKIYLDEFREYFGDQFLSKEDLDTLFSDIDTDHNGSIDTEELCSYFQREGFSEFAPLFESVEELNAGLAKSLFHTRETYQNLEFF